MTRFVAAVGVAIVLVSAAVLRAAPPLDISIDAHEQDGNEEPSYFFQGILTGPDGSEISGKAVTFTLSNSGGSILVIDRLYVKVIEATPYREYTFPRGPLAPVDTYRYTVDLNAKATQFPITQKLFKYASGEVDHFEVRFTSTERLLYKFTIVAEGYDTQTKERHTQQTGVYQIAFPEKVEYTDLLRSAKTSVDVYMHGQMASELLSDCYQFLTNTTVRTRIVVDRDFYYRSGINDASLISPKPDQLFTSSSLIMDIGYEKFANEYIGGDLERLSYFIVDNKIVLANESDRLLGKAKLYKDAKNLARFTKHFSAHWHSPPYLTPAVYEETFVGIRSPKSEQNRASSKHDETVYSRDEQMAIFLRKLEQSKLKRGQAPTNLVVIEKNDRRDEYAYLLRFARSIASISALAKNLHDADSAVVAESRASLEFLRDKTQQDDGLSEFEKQKFEAVLRGLLDPVEQKNN